MLTTNPLFSILLLASEDRMYSCLLNSLFNNVLLDALFWLSKVDKNEVWNIAQIVHCVVFFEPTIKNVLLLPTNVFNSPP